ncbi:AI-2E family transporter YdiK [Mycobacterium sp. KBS0706]|uniref:AI-2E family transporter YdiK n=1 Tax=Mycobacterium sp. KBS0706 TaxID=2578109 RepID=UPI00110FD122|nr:AI-2E family transporter YdiK [Mycobacterium sp. KBS0706]TSD83112.1 AI-2E family transporter YdiK [Mycobacterium sp. KBS0706]
MAVLRQDLARITLAVLFIALLIGACLWILRPFLPAMIWAAMLVIASWPLLRRVQARLWNSRGLAVTVMTVSILLVFVIPFWLAVGTIVRHSGEIVEWGVSVTSAELPPPPAWLEQLPLVGPDAARAWHSVGEAGISDLLVQVRPYSGRIMQWFLDAMGGLGGVLLQFLLTVVVAAIMYARGEAAAAMVQSFGIRLAGMRGEQVVILAGQAIRGVALGVVVTALIQSAIGTFGLMLVGFPFASVLCAVMFMLCIAQIGPGLVLVPAVVWMFVRDDTGWAIALLAVSLVAMTVDNFIRPVLIRRGADLPLLLILAGVIGGLIAFGLVGIFLGPTILAIGYTLLRAWIDEADAGREELEIE